MTGQELDLTAAIDAATRAEWDAIWPETDWESVDSEFQAEFREGTKAGVEAALPHIREALAGLIENEASGPDTSPTTDQALFMAARIVRGEP